MKQLTGYIAGVLLLLAAQACFAQQRDIVRFGRDVTVEEGMTVHNAVAIGANLIVNGTVTNDAVSVGGTVVLGPNARVGHNAVVVGGELRRDPAARISGDTVEVSAPGVPAAVARAQRRDWRAFFWSFRIGSFIGFLALSLIVAALIPRQIEAVSSAVESDLLLSVLWGIAGTALIVPVALLLLISIIGILVVPFEVLAVALAYIVGYIAVSQLIGKRVLHAFHDTRRIVLLETCIGVVLLFLAGFIPVLGWFIVPGASIVGLGAIIVALYAHRRARPAPVAGS